MADNTAGQASNGADPDDPKELEAVADRLEAALDRIVRHLEAPRAAQPPAQFQGQSPAPGTAELAARLDGLIGRLHDVLGDPGPPD